MHNIKTYELWNKKQIMCAWKGSNKVELLYTIDVKLSTTLQLKKEKEHWQNSISFHDKNSQQIRFRRNVPQHNEDHYVKLTANFTLDGEKLKAFLRDQEKDKDAYPHHF